jgi:hypothetical protein
MELAELEPATCWVRSGRSVMRPYPAWPLRREEAWLIGSARRDRADTLAAEENRLSGESLVAELTRYGREGGKRRLGLERGSRRVAVRRQAPVRSAMSNSSPLEPSPSPIRRCREIHTCVPPSTQRARRTARRIRVPERSTSSSLTR